MNDEDEEFLLSFEQCSLSGKCLTHSAHIRMAWLQMERSDTFEQALERIRTGLKVFNSSVKTTVPYHETITVAFARIIHGRRLEGKVQTWQEFLVQNNDLLSKNFLAQYYSPDLLLSTEARHQFIEPDRQPLPVGEPSHLL
jgi:hypothetical protein